MKLTDLEKEFMDSLNQPNGNGYNIVEEENEIGTHSDYYSLCTMFFKHDNNTTKGVVGSLVKKGLLLMSYDDEERESVLELTEKGLEYYL